MWGQDTDNAAGPTVKGEPSCVQVRLGVPQLFTRAFCHLTTAPEHNLSPLQMMPLAFTTKRVHTFIEYAASNLER